MDNPSIIIVTYFIKNTVQAPVQDSVLSDILWRRVSNLTMNFYFLSHSDIQIYLSINERRSGKYTGPISIIFVLEDASSLGMCRDEAGFLIWPFIFDILSIRWRMPFIYEQQANLFKL